MRELGDELTKVADFSPPPIDLRVAGEDLLHQSAARARHANDEYRQVRGRPPLFDPLKVGPALAGNHPIRGRLMGYGIEGYAAFLKDLFFFFIGPLVVAESFVVTALLV